MREQLYARQWETIESLICAKKPSLLGRFFGGIRLSGIDMIAQVWYICMYQLLLSRVEVGLFRKEGYVKCSQKDRYVVTLLELS